MRRRRRRRRDDYYDYDDEYEYYDDEDVISTRGSAHDIGRRHYKWGWGRAISGVYEKITDKGLGLLACIVLIALLNQQGQGFWETLFKIIFMIGTVIVVSIASLFQYIFQ